MKSLLPIVGAALMCGFFASCTYSVPGGGDSVAASNGLMRGTPGAPMTMAAGPLGANPASALADERAKKSQAFNTLP